MNTMDSLSSVVQQEQQTVQEKKPTLTVTQGNELEEGNTLRDCVKKALTNYFANLDGTPVTDVHNMVLTEIEAPLLEVVMKYHRNNQSKACVTLGLNRGTLRKKLKQYGML
jgi:Fis family transcriptional regulator